MYQISEQERAVAMATSRNRGAVGRNAIVPRVVREYAHRDDTILDFGCGKDAAHVMDLREEGYQKAMGYDFHLPASAIALQCQFDVVYLSNVLNVQDTPAMLTETIRQAWACVAPGGVLICNLPESPRKGAYACLVPSAQVRYLWGELVKVTGCFPRKVGGTNRAPVFKMTKEY